MDEERECVDKKETQGEGKFFVVNFQKFQNTTRNDALNSLKIIHNNHS